MTKSSQKCTVKKSLRAAKLALVITLESSESLFCYSSLFGHTLCIQTAVPTVHKELLLFFPHSLHLRILQLNQTLTAKYLHYSASPVSLSSASLSDSVNHPLFIRTIHMSRPLHNLSIQFIIIFLCQASSSPHLFSHLLIHPGRSANTP